VIADSRGCEPDAAGAPKAHRSDAKLIESDKSREWGVSETEKWLLDVKCSFENCDQRICFSFEVFIHSHFLFSGAEDIQ
jgi:hypothetical protein